MTNTRHRGAQLLYGNRTLQIGAFPASIDAIRFQRLAESHDTQLRAKLIREQLSCRSKVLLAVDRLDYTKGIVARLRAYREMLVEGTISVPDCVMIQVAVPTRQNLRTYCDERIQIEKLVDELNSRFGQMGAPAVHYICQSLPIEELVALYCAADVVLVTPYKDGMNLVVKEYVASRIDDLGSVVLSEFAGAAESMSAAYLVNPHHSGALKDAISAALGSSTVEQRHRMSSLRHSVRSWTSAHWGNAFLSALAGVRAPALRRPAALEVSS